MYADIGFLDPGAGSSREFSEGLARARLVVVTQESLDHMTGKKKLCADRHCATLMLRILIAMWW